MCQYRAKIYKNLPPHLAVLYENLTNVGNPTLPYAEWLFLREHIKMFPFLCLERRFCFMGDTILALFMAYLILKRIFDN